MLFWLAISCVKYGPIQVPHKSLITALEKAESDEWVRKCAPQELALAVSHKQFAEIEFAQGGRLRAEEHIAFAMDNVEKAQIKADVCRPKDMDGDGIMDNVDECPKIPELFNQYKDEDGCPEKDTDGDTIFDDSDSCMTVPEDMDNFEDLDGCPEYDNDKDGIVDVTDKCPNIPEDYDGYKDEDGCPEETGDTDGDGILDDIDMCIKDPETFNSYRDEDGCPDTAPKGVRVTKTAIIIDEKIYFQTDKAVILPKSYSILNSVAQAMKDYENIHVQVQGHTDSDGSDSYNLKLSNRRANAVREYLVKAGIDESRLESKGFGESTPIAENTTAAGKEKNRRVEFKIISGME